MSTDTAAAPASAYRHARAAGSSSLADRKDDLEATGGNFAACLAKPVKHGQLRDALVAQGFDIRTKGEQIERTLLIDGDLRAVELLDHPFFVATLFQPERAALQGTLPPLVRALVDACVETRS